MSYKFEVEKVLAVHLTKPFLKIYLNFGRADARENTLQTHQKLLT